MQQAKLNEQLKEVKELREFVKNKLYPAVLEHSTSVLDAQMLCEKLTNEIQEAMIKKAATFMLSELDIPSLKAPEEKNRERDILKLFLEFHADKSSLLLQGMKNQIKQSLYAEEEKRQLKDLDVKFYA